MDSDMNVNDGQFEDVEHDYEEMDDADVALQALVGDALEVAVTQDFSDAAVGALPVNGENTDVASMEEDGDTNDAQKGRMINNSEQAHELTEESMELVKVGKDEPVGVNKSEHEVTLKKEHDLDEEEDIMEVSKYEEPEIMDEPATKEAQKDAFCKQPEKMDSTHGRKSNPKTEVNQSRGCDSNVKERMEGVKIEEPEVVEVHADNSREDAVFKQPPDPTQGRKNTNPMPVSNQAPGRNQDSTPPSRTPLMRRSEYVRQNGTRGREHNRSRWPQFYPLKSIDMNTPHGGYGGKRFRCDRPTGHPTGCSGYYTSAPIIPIRRSRSLQVTRISNSSDREQNSGPIQRQPTLPTRETAASVQPDSASVSSSPAAVSSSPAAVSSSPAAVPSSPASAPSSPAPVPSSPAPVRSSSAPRVLPGQSTPPGSVSAVSRSSSVVYEEVPEPLFAIVSCKGFKLEDRLALRAFLSIESGDRIAKDPNDPNLLVVQKSFTDPTKAEHFKLGFSHVYFGEDQDKVVVKLLAKPTISLGVAAVEPKRPVGRPPKKM